MNLSFQASFADRRRNQGGRELLAAVLLLLSACQRTPNAEEAFAHARQTFIHGDLLASQQEAESGYRRFVKSSPEWAAKFGVLEAESLLWRGMYQETIHLLEVLPLSAERQATISILTIEALANTRLHNFKEAEVELAQADRMCAASAEATCGEVIRTRGLFVLEKEQFSLAEVYFKETLPFAREHGDDFLESTALLNLSAVALLQQHFDEAIDRSEWALSLASKLEARDIIQVALGNLGWAYYKLGDDDKAADNFNKAVRAATELGDDLHRLRWQVTSAYVRLNHQDYAPAEQAYVEALRIARRIDSKEDIVNALLSLGLVSQRVGKLSEAADYSDSAIAMARADGNRLDELYPLLVKGQVAAQLHDTAKAESIFREVANDPQSDSSLKWEAQHSLARLEEDEGQRAPARREYEAALCTFETARSSVHHEESKLPFFTNAARIYDDYISFLIKSGQARRALEVADYSRGRTLAEGLGFVRNDRPCAAPQLNPERVAGNANATILYYWLGQQQSYLWAITSRGVRNYALPPAAQINESVRRYREALVNGEDVVATANQDGLHLYQQLVAPAIPLLDAKRQSRAHRLGDLSGTRGVPQRLKPASFSAPGGTAGSRALPNPAESSSNLRLGASAPRVIVVPDGTLNSLNFETLLAPGNPAPHYWIEDATITNVQSLRLLAAEKSMSDKLVLSKAEGNVRSTAKLLLVGNAVPHPPEYPALPNAELEIQNIDKHFPASAVTQYTQSSATAAAFLDSKPEQYSYIHFVAHAVASSQVPLDSAVILSPSGKDDSFKLYARDIIQHRLRARLVTVSACYGAGTRSYNGEGLIGLSWAFLRAGAHNTIGALWEVNDASTPQLMDHFYAELEKGQRPDVALRDAKLALMHSSNVLSKPFYWAPFQLYGTS
jgi:CHAT domain-containing protein